MRASFIKIIAGFLGFSGVALGAFGAHAWRGALVERGMLATWETAVHYQLVHAVALVALAGWGGRGGRWVACAWGVGVVLFSGSLYWMAWGGPKWLWPFTPLGGVGLLIGWAGVVWAGVRELRTEGEGL